MRISDWSSDVCSSDLLARGRDHQADRTGDLRNAGRGDDEVGLRHPGRHDRKERRRRREVAIAGIGIRSEEHTSELQSLMRISYAVFCLKKKNTLTQHPYPTQKIQTHNHENTLINNTLSLVRTHNQAIQK